MNFNNMSPKQFEDLYDDMFRVRTLYGKALYLILENVFLSKRHSDFESANQFAEQVVEAYEMRESKQDFNTFFFEYARPFIEYIKENGV
jgi:hypothetical protein